MEELSEEQIEEFKEAFSLFDQEGKGYIYTKELGTVLRSLGIHTSDEEKNEFINRYDTSGEGIIYFNDFLEIIVNKIAETKPEDELMEAFKLFDTEKKLIIHDAVFKDDLKTYAPDLDNTRIEEIVSFLLDCSGGDKKTNYILIQNAVQTIMESTNGHLNK